ncbi:MAG: DUF3108 domain-containing protein [Moheibacter sp.]
MKYSLAFLFLIFLSTSFTTGGRNNFQTGEFLQYRIHYGLLNAGFASLEIENSNYDGRPHFHMIGKGSSAGAVRAFYKVDDRYDTYVDASTGLPTKFIRNIDEGGYKRYQVMTFDHRSKIAKVDDRLKNTVTYFNFEQNVQDLISAFYYLRNYNTDRLKTNDFMEIDVLMADGVYKFKLKVLGRENFKTKYGNIKCLKVRPYVQSGRVFKESESVTMWVTDDNNHVPVHIKAELAVGSLKADLNSYKNLKYPLNFTK